jgi:putative ABC transport system permease protein
MIKKLAFRNARRTLGDYLIYIMTVSFAIAMDHALNNLMFSEQIQRFSNISSGFTIILIGTSALMMFTVAMLIQYMTKFILEKRSKEFGLYQLMGIEKKDITKLYWFEQIFLGLISLLFGLFLGVILGEVLEAIVYNFLGLDYSLDIVFFNKTIILTIFVTLVSYLLAAVFSSKLFKNQKIIHWIQADRINEKVKYKNPERMDIVFKISILVTLICLTIIYWQIKIQGSFKIISLSILILIISTYNMAANLSIIFNKRILKDNDQYTKAVLPIRFIGAKINLMSRQMGTLTIVLVAGFSFVLMGFLFGRYYKLNVTEYSNFDILYRDDLDNGDFVKKVDDIISKYGIEAKANISTYGIKDSDVYDIMINNSDFGAWQEFEPIISISDYNEFRILSGKKPIHLEKGSFLVQGASTFIDLEKILPIDDYNISGESLHLQEIITEPMNTRDIGFTQYYIVVNDDKVSDQKPIFKSYLWKIKDKDIEALNDDLLKLVVAENGKVRKVITGTDERLGLPYNFLISEELLDEMKVSTLSFTISMLFMGLLFFFVMTTVLAVSILSETKQYKSRYELLSKLGLDNKELSKMIWKQILFLFIFPIVLGLPVAIILTMTFSMVFQGYMSGGYIVRNLLMTLMVFGLVYILYMLATYQTYKKMIF